MGRGKRRAAYSLMEVIVAAAILLGSTIVLAQLAGIGREHAWRAEETTRAQVLCQNTLNELLAGIQPLEPREDQPFPHDPDWNYTLEVEPLDRYGLVSVRVTVNRVAEGPGPSDSEQRRARGYGMVRWMRSTATPSPLGREAAEGRMNGEPSVEVTRP